MKTKFVAGILAVAASMIPFIPASATDVFTWKPGKFKLFAGGVQGAGKLGTIIPISSLGQATTFTIPDPGAATANFVLDTGAASAQLLQHVAIPITSASILGMYAAPVLLIAAPATGQTIIVNKAMITMIPSGTAYASGGVVGLQIGNTVHGGGTATTATVAAAVINAAGTTTSYTTVIDVSYTGISATGLYLSNQTGAFATGTGTAIVDVWYSIK